jgi:hypothetical protein
MVEEPPLKQKREHSGPKTGVPPRWRAREHLCPINLKVPRDTTRREALGRVFDTQKGVSNK